MADPKRFNTLAQPTAAPGCCLLCSGATGPFIDPNQSIQWHGRIFICFKCLGEMARELPREANDADRALQRGYRMGLTKAQQDADSRFASSLGRLIRDLGISDSAISESQNSSQDKQG